MTVPLSPTSQRRVYAAKFAAEFRKAMETRGISIKAIERATGSSHTNLWTYKSGNNLPRLETALRMAETLGWPKLAAIVREGRTAMCARPRCGQTFLNEGGNCKRYCSADCREINHILNGQDFEPGGRALLASVRAEIDRVQGTTHSVSRKALQRAANEYATSGSKRGTRLTTLETMLERHRAAAGAFCRSCEPDGLCQTPTCELRPLSPLPLANDRRSLTTAVKASGRWRGASSAAQRAQFSDELRRRWNEPGRRQRMAAVSRARWAALTSEERAALGRRISIARRSASEEPAA